jgi:Family of unknown function (DUF6159)
MSFGPENPVDPIFTHQVGRVGEGRIARSWRLTQVCWTLIGREPALLALAALQTLFTTIAAIVLFVLRPHSTVDAYGLHHSATHNVRFYLLVGIAAWITTAISAYFGVALASAASHALRGKHATVGEALRLATSRLPDIILWSLIAAVVGLALRIIIERIPLGGRVLTFLVGLAWAIATFFVIAVLALEGCPATAAAQRSAQLVRRRWAEGLSGTVIISAWTALALFGTLGVGIVGFAIVGPTNPAAGLAIVGLMIVAFIAISVVSNTVRQVFAVALYRYARDGDAIGGFDAADLASPFVPRRSRR